MRARAREPVLSIAPIMINTWSSHCTVIQVVVQQKAEAELERLRAKDLEDRRLKEARKQTMPIDTLMSWLSRVLLRLQLQRPSDSELRPHERRPSGVEPSRRRKQQRTSDVKLMMPRDVEQRRCSKQYRPSDVEWRDSWRRRKQQRSRAASSQAEEGSWG